MFSLIGVALAAQMTLTQMEWERIQVENIAGFAVVRSLEDVMSRRDAELLRLLDHDDYLIRSLAANDFEQRGMGAYTVLCWGLRIKNRQIHQACVSLICKLYACDNCGGTGVCPTCLGVKNVPNHEWCPANCNYMRECKDCVGSGDKRYIFKYYDKIMYVDPFPGCMIWERDPNDLQ